MEEQFGGNQILSSKYNEIKILKKDDIKLVYLAEKKNNKKKVIIKQFDLSDLDKETKDEFRKEGETLTKIRHPNVIKFYDFYYKNNIAYIITEYIETGTLFDKIEDHKIKNEYFDENILLEWFIDICEGMKEINENNIIYRTLKPDNIFITKDNRIKIGDFGIAQLYNYKNQNNINIGIITYLSPEIIKNLNYNYKSDIWSLGIVLYELTQLFNPFIDEDTTDKEIIMHIENGEYFNFLNLEYSEKLLNLIDEMLKVPPNKRIELNEIILECYTIIIKKDSKSKNK